MQPSNPRLETSGNDTRAPSGVNGASVKGKAPEADTTQVLPVRGSRNERREQNQRQQQQQPEQPQRLSLAELFAEPEDGETIDDDGNVIVEDTTAPPDSMEALSKRLGFKPEQLYNVKIPMPDGAEPLTIGQLKDRVGELVDLETRELQFEQRHMRMEGELLRAQAEIRDILTMIPKEQIRPEIVNKIRQRHNDNMARERAMTLEHIPEWRNEQRAAQDLQGMTEFLGEYGFDESFIASVHDHRAVKFIRDMYLRDKRIKAALSKVTTPETKSYRASAKTKKPAARPSQNVTPSTRRTGAAASQQSRIAALFNTSE